MVLHAQFAGLASLRSAPSPPLPSSNIGRKFQRRPTLLSSPGSPPKIHSRPPLFHICSPTHRICSAAAARRDPDYPKPKFTRPATPGPDPPYPKPKYEKSIFLHIWDEYHSPKKPLEPTADPGNPKSSKADNVRAPNSGEGVAKEEAREPAVESKQLANGRGKGEGAAIEDSGEIAAESYKLADGGGKEECVAEGELAETAVECDGGGNQEAKQEYCPQQIESSRRRTAEEEIGETAVDCSELADGRGAEEEEQQQQDFSSEQFASGRGGNVQGADANVGVATSDKRKGQIRAAEGDLSDWKGSDEDLTGQEVVDQNREAEQSEGFYTGNQPTSGSGSNAEVRSHAGFKEFFEGTESGFNDRFVDEEVEEEVEDVGSNQRLGGQGIHVEADEASPSHNSEELHYYEFGNSGVGEFTSSADEQHLSASTRGNGLPELASLGLEQDVESDEANFSPTTWNSEIGNPQIDPFSGRRQGLKVGRQVYLTGEQHYKRWMPNSEAEHQLQEPSEESQTEEEVVHPISEIGESAVSLPAVDGDDETFGEKGDEWDKDIDRRKEEQVQFSLDKADSFVGETEPDLFVQFLKKRSEHWGGDSAGPFVRDTSDRLEPSAPEQNSDSLSTEEKLLFTSAEVMTTQDQASQSHTSVTSDGKNPVPNGVIPEILNIVKSLPPNASLETFLTPFCGQISTNEGNLVLKFLGENHFSWPMLSFFQWMRLQEPCLLDSRSFCSLFSCLGKLKMADQALLQYQNMPDEGAFHCVQVYNSLLGALSRAGRPEKISTILQEMENRNVERDAVTCGILIAATKGGKERYHKVWALFDDLLREGGKPNVSVYGSLIKAFCDEGHLKQALLVSLSMEKMGMFPNVIIYNTLIDAHARSGLLEEAEGLLVEMKQRGLPPVESTYNALINGYGRSGKLDVAEELVSEMEREGLRPNVATYTSLISAYGKHLSSEKAVNVFLRMKKSGLMPNPQTYTALINAYAEGGWHEKAQRAFDNMLREGLKATVETYTALLDGYRRSGDLDMVRHIWNTIKEDGCALTKITYRTIMDAFSKQGFYVEARDVMDEFKKRGLEPDTMVYNMLLNAYARGGVCTKLRKVLEEMQTAGCEPDTYTYCTLIYTYIRHRDFTSAFKYDNEMQERGLTPSPNIYGKMRSILDSKYAEKVENDKKANAGQGQEGSEKAKGKNPQRKKSNFKRYQRRGPRRGSERAKALWKERENQGTRERRP